MLWHGTHLPLVERDHVLDLHLDDVVDPLVEGGEADAGQDVQQQHRHHHRHRRVPVRQPQADNQNRCDCEFLREKSKLCYGEVNSSPESLSCHDKSSKIL